MGVFIDISGQQFGNWLVLEYSKDNRKWLCECQCNLHTRKLITSADLRKGKSTNCGCQRKKDLTGKQFGHLIVDGYAEDYHWNCHCIECGKQFRVHTYHLEHGNIPNCTHSELHTNVDDITGKTFGQWKVISYAGNKYWNCECQCELHTKRQVLGKDLRSGKSKSCGLEKPGVVALMNSSNEFIDLKDMQFGEWTVDKYVGNGFWQCTCSCGTVKKVSGKSLKSGNTKSCGHASGVLKDISNQTFGELTALEHIGYGYWKCKCSCGNIVDVHGHQLRLGHTKSCGDSIHRYKNIKGQRFGMLIANEYIGGGKWRCQCDCGNIVDVFGMNLRSGGTQSCGCSSSEKRIKTDIKNGKYRYRSDKQILALKSQENLEKFIGGKKLTIIQLSRELGVPYSYIVGYIGKKFDLSNIIIKQTSRSQLEIDLTNYIKSIYHGTVETSNKTVLNGKELDIYIPEKKIAIEFNGTYWHSDINKPVKYHQEKTIECIRHGVRLIHIFEYEWINTVKQNKIKEYLNNILNNNNIIYARNTKIAEVTSTDEYTSFENRYHLQGTASSSIRLGLYYNNELIGLMTFGKPRFNNNYEYEIIRLCYKSNINVVGGTEKLFKYFIEKYSPKSIISYCDISKFDGNTYLKLGFTADKNSLTSPNYVWVSYDRKDVLTRYQTQKHKLLELGLGTPEQSEDDIMKDMEYLKIYDCGNMRFEWKQV